MAKGLIKDSTLTAIANAIREKTGTTGAMLPAEMAALIQGITGGKIAYGSLTLPEKTGALTITHDLGVTPDIVYIAQTDDATVSSNTQVVTTGVLWPDKTGEIALMTKSATHSLISYTQSNYSTYFTTLDSETVVMNVPSGMESGGVVLRRFGGTYYWLVGVAGE